MIALTRPIGPALTVLYHKKEGDSARPKRAVVFRAEYIYEKRIEHT